MEAGEMRKGKMGNGDCGIRNGGLSAFRIPNSAFRIREDYRTARDWLRPWRDPPGFFLPNCPCCGSDTPMYALGGADAGLTTNYMVADKIMMTAETSSAVTTANLSQARQGLGSVGNPAIAGYFCGGATTSTSPVATTDKLTMSNDATAATTTANLSQARAQLYGLSERLTKGYLAGGFTSGTPVVAVKTADKITFSGDSAAAQTTAQLSTVRKASQGLSEGSSKGYWAGGYTGSIVTSCVVTADRVTFASDTTAAQTTANLSAARAELESGSDGSRKGYFCGGQTGAASAKVDKIAFSTDTTAALTSQNFGQYWGASGSNGTKMFAAAGVDSVTGIFAGSRKVTFASDTAASAAFNLSQVRQGLAGVSYQA